MCLQVHTHRDACAAEPSGGAESTLRLGLGLRGEEDAVSQGLAGGSGRQAACHAMWGGVRGPVGSACRAQEGPVAPLDSKGDTV